MAVQILTASDGLIPTRQSILINGAVLGSHRAGVLCPQWGWPARIQFQPHKVLMAADDDSPEPAEALFRMVVDRIPGIIWSTDADLRFTSSMGAGLTALGLRPGQVVGTSLFDFFRTSNPEFPAIAAHRRALSGESVGLEQVWMDRTYQVHIRPLLDGTKSIVGCMGFAQDITEHRRAEQALQQAHAELERRVKERTAELARANERLVHEIQERRRAEQELGQSHEELQAIYDGMTDGLLVADVQTKRFVRANDTICRMLGYTEAELLDLSVVDIHPKEELPEVLRKFDLQAQGKLHVAEGLPVQCKDQSVFYADVATSSIVYQGRPCLIGFFRDTTERRRIQEALRREREVLKQLLAASDQERQMIAYEIHDVLAQQIAGAKMQFEVLGSFMTRLGVDAQHAQSETARLLDDSMTEVRRLISGLRPPVLDEKGVVAAIEHFVDDARNHVGIGIEFHRDVVFERLEPTLENTLLRIVQEGVNNAKKHSRTDRVRIELHQTENALRLEIRDWGVGFEPSAATHGFGLEGIRQRARLHGGNASVESTPGQGTVIVVNLPVVEREMQHGL